MGRPVTSAIEQVTIPCGEPGCEFEVTGPASGQNSAPMRIGTHRWAKHKKRGDGKRQKSGKPSREQLHERPVVTTLRSVTAEMAGAGAPTESQLVAGLAEGLSLLSVIGAATLAETDPNIARGANGEDDRDAVVAYLTLPIETAEDIVRPLAKAFQPTKLNRKYGRGMVNNVGVVGSFVDVYRLFLHYRFYLDTRRQGASAIHGGPQITPQPPTGGDGGPVGGPPPPAGFAPPSPSPVVQASQMMASPHAAPAVPPGYVPLVPGGREMSAGEIEQAQRERAARDAAAIIAMRQQGLM